MVEYCSLLAKDSDFSGNKEDIHKPFSAIGCDCLLDTNAYEMKFVSKNADKCSHATMINDSVLISFIGKLISKNELYENLDLYNKDIQTAFKNYNRNENYQDTCNQKLVTKFFNK